MIYVNDAYFGEAFFAERFQAFSRHEVLANCKGKRIALCSSNPAYILALCLYLKEHGGSFYPIHADMPRLAAKRLAVKAQCHALMIETEQQCYPLGRTESDTEAVLVQTSSGTTGDPKVICRPWSSIEQELTSYTSAFTVPNSMTPVIACPVTHSYGLIAGVLVALKRGQIPLIINQLNPKYLIKVLQQTPNHLLYSSPALLQSVASLYPASQRLHAVMTSGTLLSKACFELLLSRAEHVFQQYGCSEVGCIAINSKTESAENLGAILPHLQVQAGGNAKEPEEVIVRVGEQTIFTRDLGYFDHQQHLCFVSRVDDTINVAGLNVYPKDVEDAVLELPSVSEAVVFKRKDSLAGEKVCLQFVADEALPPSRIRSWCQTRLAAYQLPVEVEQVAEIEKLPNGKVNRKALAETAVAIPALG
ncbi:acyl-CoA synthase [Photobacterium sanctipauli]|uniref:Acyl-CoA synthase n=1 Tax=Photobacterium sanctipauli TaxID=1342794 RepID=A0A2T3NB76_9GAMM|nr:AMP-binding protein [Photobacterium sanctipauli]PSW11051.1 acyl-CoA synthase [Photobacterium sanctipauli]